MSTGGHWGGWGLVKKNIANVFSSIDEGRYTAPYETICMRAKV
jgi:hypothetical protein